MIITIMSIELLELEVARGGCPLAVCAKSPPAMPAAAALIAKAVHLEPRGRRAHGLGGDLVFSDGRQRATGRGRMRDVAQRRSPRTTQRKTQKKLV